MNSVLTVSTVKAASRMFAEGPRYAFAGSYILKGED